MTIAYVLNTYPQPSHSFIRREIQALERQGLPVLRLAMRRSELALVDPGDRAEAERTRYVLDLGAAGLLRALAGAALHRPGRFWAALRLALRLARRGRSGPLRPLVYLAEACAVNALCADAGVTHVHAHFGTNSTAVAMLGAALGGPGYSFTVHGPEEFDDPTGLALDEKIRRARFVVGVSAFGRSQLCRWAAFDDWPKLKVVHCGIEPAAFADPAPPPEAAGPRLVAIGRFVEQKGQLTLIGALARLRATLPGLHLTLVGDGPLRPEIERAIEAAGLGAQIGLTGWLDEAGVRAEIARADALVMPSFAEGLPMVIMEAMAMARPVLASTIAGIPELVRPGETGWRVPAGDEAALAEALAALAATPPAQRAALGEAGRARALARHDADREAASLAGYFAESA